MANRTGTYMAFDGLGETNPTKSDYRYYSTFQAWRAGKHIEFQFTNSHEKTATVKDTSKRATLESRILQRLAASKNMVVILSDDTRKTGSMLSYEITKAVDRYQIPLICMYVGYTRIFKPEELKHRWPDSLAVRIKNSTTTAIHIPFSKNALFDAIKQFTVHSCPITGPLNFYSEQAHREFGLYPAIGVQI